MNNKNPGFSLIELMVVIAIVAILAAVAVPLYKNYVARSKIASGLATVHGIGTKIQNYYSAKGAFPTNTDIGLPDGNAWDPSTQGYYFPPYIAIYQLGPNGPLVGSQCPYVENVSYISNYDGDFSNPADTSAKLIIMNSGYFDVKGTIIYKCTYAEYDASFTMQADRGLIPNCYYNNPTILQDTIDNACL